MTQASTPSMSNLPTPISSLLDGIHTFNASKISSSFSKEVLMIDENKEYRNQESIHAWAQEALVNHKAKVKVTAVTKKRDQIVLSIVMDGNFKEDYGITEPFNLYFYFTLDESEEKITYLEITGVDPSQDLMDAVWASKGNLQNPASSIQSGHRPVPTPPEGWVKVKMLAAALNQHDIFTLRGIGIVPLTFPLIMGCEGVGLLDNGQRVLIYLVMNTPGYHGDETLDPGRNVPSELTQGTLAEYVIMPKENIIPLPDSISNEIAAVLGCAWLVAYRSLFTKSNLKPGQTMLVQGASGGVATALIQLGSAAGMRVWVVGRSDEKRSMAKRLGAARTFAPGETLPEEVDAVFDMAGAATWESSVKAVKIGGTIVTCGVHSGMDPPAGLMKIFTQQITVTGVYAGTMQELKDLVSFVIAKGIKPEISEVLPLKSAPEGLRKVLNGETGGKIVISME